MRDITERKQAEHEIKRQAAFAHFNPNPVLELSPSGEIMYFNAAALQMAGSLGMKHPAEIMPSNTAAIVSDCLATSKPLLRLETRAKDRTISWSFFPVAITQAVHCYAGDVTERKQAEEQMNLQSGALTAAANAIVITDRNGAIEWVNPSFTRLTGYSAEEAIGGNPRLLKSGQHPPSFYATLWSTVRTGNVWHGEMVNKRKDGRLYTEDMTITPVRAADGQIAHFVAIKQDVTDRKELENKLQQVQKMEAIGRLAGGIAHDFNNILAAMFGFGFLLQQDTEGNPAAQESIGEILKAATRAKELVQQILTFSRQREQKRQVIHLDPVIKEAMKFLRASLPANIDIEINLATDAPAVLADSTQIYQVAVNLATNALHAMEGKPGRLTISLDGFRPDESFIRTHSEFRRELYARLTFSDTGHGMDAKTLERVFEPFFTTKAVGKGTGLGLAVVHGIVQSHEGAITVQSEINQGTTFRLYFPAQAAGSLATEPTLAKFARGRGEKILILDDEPALTKALQQILIRLNYHVTSSNCAAEALALFDKDSAQFDLIITDHTMPEMDGLEVARRIHTVCPDLPILLATGFSDSLTPEIRREAGIGELIEKPVSTSVLADIVHRTLMGQKV
jgi:PAS domain S-box-containing protein